MVSNILNKVRSVIALVMQKSSLILRMILKFVCFYLLFKNISSMSYFSGTGLFNDNAIQLILAAVATVLPNRSGILIALAIVIYNVYQTSVVGAIIVGLLLILLYIITSSLFPEYTYLLALVPIAIHFNIFLAVPLFTGLYIGFSAIVPVVMGVLMYGMIQIVPAFLNLQMDASLDKIPKLISDSTESGLAIFTTNEEMKFLVVLSAAVVVLISLLKLLRFRYSRYIAIGVSGIFGIVYMMMGISGGRLNAEPASALIWAIVAVAVLAFFEFMKISANYKEARSLEFEDEDYLYQVRMIPKNGIFGSRRRAKMAKQQQESGEVNQEPAAAAATAAPPLQSFLSSEDSAQNAPNYQAPRKRKKAEEVVRPSEDQIRDAKEKARISAMNASGYVPVQNQDQMGAQPAREADQQERLDLPLPSAVPGAFEETRRAPAVSDAAYQDGLSGETKAVIEGITDMEKTPRPRSVLAEDEPQDVFDEFGSNR